MSDAHKASYLFCPVFRACSITQNKKPAFASDFHKESEQLESNQHRAFCRGRHTDLLRALPLPISNLAHVLTMASTGFEPVLLPQSGRPFESVIKLKINFLFVFFATDSDGWSRTSRSSRGATNLPLIATKKECHMLLPEPSDNISISGFFI